MSELILSKDERITNIKQASKRLDELNGWLVTYTDPRGAKEKRERLDVESDVERLKAYIATG